MKALCLVILLGFFSTTIYANPSTKALDASLASIDSKESYGEIKALFGAQDKYATSYKSYLKRYHATQEEHTVIAKKFKEADIPLFFSLIPYCESNFRNDVRGTNTAGLWQFTAQSGRRYGLFITKNNDERINAHHSTDAAIRYIKDLKKTFGDWYLVDFAYGMGELKLQRLIKKNGSKKLSVLLRDPEFPKGTKSHFIKTLLLDATIHHTIDKE